jgi:hypothetical protein
MSSTNVVRSTGVTSEPERPVEPKMLVLSATLMVVGFFALPIAGAFHPDGPLNDHRAVFTEYARSVGWTADHVAFFAVYAITIAGLVALFYALDLTSGMPRQLSRLGIAAAGAALALSAVRFAVDGVVLKRAVDAWHDEAILRITNTDGQAHLERRRSGVSWAVGFAQFYPGSLSANVSGNYRLRITVGRDRMCVRVHYRAA